MRRIWGILLLTPALVTVSPASAGDLRFGWQVGVTQAAQGLVSGGASSFDVVGTSSATAPFVASVGGLTFTTVANLTTSLDYSGHGWDHGLVAGIALNQQVPTLQPRGVAGVSQTGFTANASYLARRARALWAIELGTNYAFGLNGQLAPSENGGTNVTGDVGATGEVGRFTVRGQSHAVGFSSLLSLDRARWDASLRARYDFSLNGAATLITSPAAGLGTPLTAFVPATTHTFNPSAELRRRFGRNNLAVITGSTRWTIPVVADLEEGLAQNVVPETLAIEGSGTIEHRFVDETRGFVSISSTLGYRVPTSLAAEGESVSGLPIIDRDTGQPFGLRPDTLIYRSELGLEGRLVKLEIGYRLSAGVAQARLFQPALGTAQERFAVYTIPVVGAVLPIFSGSLDRRFDPVDLNLIVSRSVALGGLGASAVINDSASLAASVSIRATSSTELRVSAGVSANRVSNAGGDQVPTPPRIRGARGNEVLAALTTGSASLGARLSVDAPLYRAGGLAFDGNASYGYTYIDPTIDTVPDPDRPLAALAVGDSHSILVSVRGTFGDGPVDAATTETVDERLDAYTTNPRDGSPLISARLLNLRGAGQQQQSIAPGIPAANARSAGGSSASKGQSVGVTGNASASSASRVGRAGEGPEIAPPKAQTPRPDVMTPFDESQLIRPIRTSTPTPAGSDDAEVMVETP